MLPLFLMMKELGLVNSFGGVIVPALATVFGIFLVRQYTRSIPDECSRRRVSTAPASCGSSSRSCCRCSTGAGDAGDLHLHGGLERLHVALIVLTDQDHYTLPWRCIVVARAHHGCRTDDGGRSGGPWCRCCCCSDAAAVLHPGSVARQREGVSLPMAFPPSRRYAKSSSPRFSTADWLVRRGSSDFEISQVSQIGQRHWIPAFAGMTTRLVCFAVLAWWTTAANAQQTKLLVTSATHRDGGGRFEPGERQDPPDRWHQRQRPCAWTTTSTASTATPAWQRDLSLQYRTTTASISSCAAIRPTTTCSSSWSMPAATMWCGQQAKYVSHASGPRYATSSDISAKPGARGRSDTAQQCQARVHRLQQRRRQGLGCASMNSPSRRCQG